MSYIGKIPANAVLTTADLADGIVTAAKIEDGTVVAAEIASNAVTTAKINADAVTGAKIADDAINSEHYTDGSIDTAHIADNQITLAKLAGGTDGNIISYDASGDPVAIATGNDGQVLTSTGAGSPPAFEALPSAETNVPYFRAYMGGTNTLADNTTTKVAFDSVSWNVGGTYATGTYRWTPGTAGRYFIHSKIQIDFGDGAGDKCDLFLRKNGSNVNYHRIMAGGNHGASSSVNLTCTVDLDADDYVEVFAEQNSDAGKNFDGTSQYNWWEGFLIAKT